MAPIYTLMGIPYVAVLDPMRGIVLRKTARKRMISPGQLSLDFNETKHPRDKGGRFASKGSGEGIKVGDQFDAPGMFGMYPKTYEVKKVEDGQVHIGYANSHLAHTSMPEASWKHFKNDLSGKVEGPNSNNPYIQAVISGKAESLGKGNSGIVFRHNGKVVKVGTTVPFQPTNPGHRSPEEAIENLKREHDTCEYFRSRGVPGIPKTEFIVHGDKGFLIRDEMEPTDKLTLEQLHKVDKIVRSIQRVGYSIRDQIQVGLTNGEPYMLDIGDAQPLEGTPSQRRDRVKDDEWRIEALYNRNNVKHPISIARKAVANRKRYRQITGRSLPAHIRPNANEIIALVNDYNQYVAKYRNTESTEG